MVSTPTRCVTSPALILPCACFFGVTAMAVSFPLPDGANATGPRPCAHTLGSFGPPGKCRPAGAAVVLGEDQQVREVDLAVVVQVAGEQRAGLVVVLGEGQEVTEIEGNGCI